MPSNHLILCHPLLLLPSIFPSIRVLSSGSGLCIRGPKCWSFSFSISLSNEHLGLISFRMDWMDLQSKGLSRVFSNTTAQEHQFFGVQPSLWSSTYIHGLNSPWGCKGSDTTEPVSLSLLSHPYRTTGKTIALIRWTFVGKVVSAF